MSEDNFKKFIDSTDKKENENKGFLICGHEISSGVCCGLEKGHPNDHEYITKEDIEHERKLRSGEIDPDEDIEPENPDANSEFPPIPNTDPEVIDYGKGSENVKGDLSEPEPQGGFVTGIVDEPHETHLDFKHNKTELGVAIGILALAVGIGAFLLYDNYDDVLLFIENIISDFEITPSIVFPPDDTKTPGEIKAKEAYDDATRALEQNPQHPIGTKNFYQVKTDGTFHGQYYDGSNKPTNINGDGNTEIPFICPYSQSFNATQFFGVFQIIEGNTLEVDLNLKGAYPSFSGTFGQGESIIWEGTCPSNFNKEFFP